MFAASAPAAALNPDRKLTQYLRDVWQRTEGLPQNTVLKIVQTRDGYLWAATQGGLVRFDGVRFTVFSSRTTPALGTEDISALLEDRAGTLWVGTAGGGLFTYRQDKLSPFTGGPLPNNVVNDLFEEPDGSLWIATAGGVARLAHGSLQAFTAADGVPNGMVHGVTRDNSGAIWIGTEGGAAKFDGRRFIPIDPVSLPSLDVRVVYGARDGSVWVGTRRGVAVFSRAGVRALTPADGLSGEFVRSIFEDAAGTMWIGTQEGGVTRIARGRLERFTAADGLSSDDVRAFATDAEGSLWIGTNVGGLVRLKEPKVVTYGRAEGLSDDVALPVTADRDGVLWVGTYGGGLTSIRNGRFTRYTVRDGLMNDVILSLAPSARGGVWVGTRDGLNRIRNGRVERFGRAAGIADVGEQALVEDRSGVLWIGTRGGLLRFDGVRATRPAGQDRLAQASVLAITETRDGRLLFGTQGAGAMVLANGRFAPFGADAGLANAVVWNIEEDAQGDLWLATNGGAVRYHDGRFTTYRARDGLIDNTIYRIIDDGAGSLWLSSNHGIQRVHREEFAAFDAHRATQLAGEWLAEGDGMRSGECNGGVQPAGWRASDGTLWFPTIKGVVHIDPQAMAHNFRPPPVVIESLAADGREVSLFTPPRFDPGVRTLEFHYTALSLRNPAKVRFKYRLDGFDPDWLDGGNRRVRIYTNLPPGSYTFRVIASNDDGVWNEVGARAAFTLAPSFQQTKAFYALIGVSLLAIALVVHRARISGLKTREKELARLAEERRWALEALTESERRFGTLFNNVAEGVCRVGADGQILLANQSMARMLGYESVDQLLEVNARDLYFDEDFAKLSARLETSDIRAAEGRMRRRDGSALPILGSIRVIRDGAGRVMYYEGTIIDITDRKQLEAQVLQLQKIESIGRLAGSVAHDFNNLLTPILGHAELLAQDLQSSPESRGRVEQIQKAAQSAKSLVRQLLAFSRRQIIKRRVLDLNAATREFEDMLRRLIGEHISLRLDLSSDLAPVRVDTGQLEQVIMNLAVNARDAMPFGGTLTIRTTNETVDEHTAAQRGGVTAGPYVRLDVTDTGEGIKPEVRERLFEPFVTTKRHGTGLGLSTVYGIVTQSGGHLTVETEQDHGTSFGVHLPAARPDAAEAPPAVATPAAASGQTILLVEDDDDVRDLAREVLERAGYHVLPAVDAEHAMRIEAGYASPIDLLLTDVVMPGLGGPALADRLRARRSGLRVLYTTGYIDDDVAHHGVLQPDVAVLEKPFTLNALLEAVEQRLAG